MRRHNRFGNDDYKESKCTQLFNLLKSDEYNIKNILQKLKENGPSNVIPEVTSGVSDVEIEQIKEDLRKYVSALTIYEKIVNNDNLVRDVTVNAINHVNACLKIANDDIDEDDEELKALVEYIQTMRQTMRETYKTSSAFGRRRKGTNTKKRITKKGVTKKGMTNKKGSR